MALMMLMHCSARAVGVGEYKSKCLCVGVRVVVCTPRGAMSISIRVERACVCTQLGANNARIAG